MSGHFVIGLTGQTGSGKSTVCNAFMEKGFEIINCDLVARAVTSDGSDCCKALKAVFPDCIDEALHLDRKALGAIVFSDKEKLEALNRIIFPFINEEIKRRIGHASQNNKKLILLDAPTLFEAGADKLCDMIVSCVALKKLRLQRIMIRDSLNEAQAEDRINSQHSEEFFRSKSDMVIENNGGLDSLARAAAFASEIIISRSTRKRDHGNKDKKEEAQEGFRS